MSGLLWPKRLPVTELFRGFTDPPKNGLVETMTPPETGVGPEGAAPEMLLPTNVVRELVTTPMPGASFSGSVSGLPVTWFFAIVVLTLALATIAPTTLPMRRFPTTVALRAPLTAITNAPFPAILKPRIVNPETLTPLTRG